MTRASRDLDAPPTFRPDAPLPSNVRRFPIVIGPEAVYLMAQGQERRSIEKAVERHKRRKGRGGGR